ncbi:evolutionarily conserved signaling intermediate in Toll pathway, mitochondrial [Drosophila guanche]|uniref:Evolutionarily conserved signaling intermediate in Toll pathway, mitochondrial n=1 Tax=Drosophila guanche TaxID=7266 RepID=A0A3B0JHR2_DROGU|nr:evolutionarily conserved signaling intermediate in Toll pathway, mitochondrial [Drosophila guanche]SPP80243.1 blast:Evolutionarily conserved signaling intermediate in Toll pathway%2C mitochondrial [Drosophila guanche]
MLRRAQCLLRMHSSTSRQSLCAAQRVPVALHKHYSADEANRDGKQNPNAKRAGTGGSKSLPAVRNVFATAQDKTKDTYLTMVEIFGERDVHRRNHVEFIYAALKHMPDFGVENDLEVYKALINVMPKGKFIPTNLFQAEFMHYPKQQQCIIDLLEQMEDFGVMPDYEMEAMLLNVFGNKGHPLRKYWRMMYWMPKFKNLSPWPLPNPVPDDTLEIAKLAVERMCTVDLRSQINVFETKELNDAVDETWIVSGMSPEQSKLLREHSRQKALYIEGPFHIWIRNRRINYFTLRADADAEFLAQLDERQLDEDDVSNIEVPFFGRPPPRRHNQLGKLRSVHQQDDGTIFAICATGTSTKDSLLSWIRLLEANGNPSIGEVPVLFRFTSTVPAKSEEIEGPTSVPATSSDSPSRSRKEDEPSVS